MKGSSSCASSIGEEYGTGDDKLVNEVRRAGIGLCGVWGLIDILFGARRVGDEEGRGVW